MRTSFVLTEHVLNMIWLRYGQEYHGQMALQIGVLVGFTQLIPEHQVQVMGIIKARVKVRCSFMNVVIMY